MPYTTVTSGSTITASWANASVRDQVVTPFATSAARASAITSPIEGMVTYLADNNRIEYYDGSAWRPGATATRSPLALVSRSSIQNIATSTDAAISFDTEVVDTDAAFAAPSTTITIQTAGVYLLIGYLDLASNASGTYRVARLKVNGSIVANVNTAPSGAFGFGVTVSQVKSLAVSNTVTLTVEQNSGVTLDVSVGATLAAVYLSPV